MDHWKKTEDYIQILIDSLKKKSLLLTNLTQKNALQEAAVLSDDTEAFDHILEEKAVLIEELNHLDQGFDLVFERVKGEIEKNPSEFKKQIREMQDLIREITDKSLGVQSQEKKNKELIEKQFRKMRQDIQGRRTSVKAATNYYKSMNSLSYDASSSIDKKK